MTDKERTGSLFDRLRYHSWFLVSLWTGCIVASLLWNLHEQREKILNIARNSAQLTFERDVIYRRWAAKQGGVYVSVSEYTPPNPYLKVPERDVTTSSGLSLTLVNPAYMTRQVNQMAAEIHSSQSHLTSLNPIRPENTPDPWEAAALKSFERGIKEVSSVEKMADGQYMRLMRPFVTEKDCLKCHASQGYKEGDVRGGISVSIPMAPLWAIERPLMARISLAHLLLWVVGIAGIVIAKKGLQKQILARERAEAVLSESANKLRIVADFTYDWEYWRSTDDRFVYVSPSCERVTGYTREKFMEDPGLYSRIIHPDDRERVAAHLSEDRCHQKLCELEFRIVRRDGQERWIGHACQAVLDADGQSLGRRASDRDITERKRADEALRQRTLELQQLTETLEQRVQERTAELAKSNEMLQAEMAERLRLVAAVEQAGEGLVIADPEGIIHYVNPAFEQMGGCRREEVLGKNYYEVLVGEDLKKEIQDVLRSGEAWSGRLSRKGRSGQPCELDVTFSPIRDQTGKVINYLAVERDVTQEVRLEQHLRQMQKIEALGTLAGGIAHDFNNILNPIFINTELVLLDTPPGSSTRELMELSLKAAERGRELVKQIITFSRQKEKERKPTKAAPLIKEALKFLRASLPSTVEIRENISGETGYIMGDPTQIHQVVMNLCSNAAYAMREQGGVMEVGLAEVEVDAEMALRYPDLKPGPYMRLTVTDTGTGMTPEVMERAFDPFFTTKKPGEGSGMGLAVVHGIVRNHEGAITVYSEVGRGSTFSVYLPEIEGGEKVETVTTGPIPGGKERILLVDDEEIQIRTIQPALERLGYRVIARKDSQEALEVFRVRPDGFDLVITDQTMPHITGLRLAEEILRIRPDVPIILCTGFSESVNGERVKAAGIREFIMKPFSARDLAQAIRRALAHE